MVFTFGALIPLLWLLGRGKNLWNVTWQLIIKACGTLYGGKILVVLIIWTLPVV